MAMKMEGVRAVVEIVDYYIDPGGGFLDRNIRDELVVVPG
jgi:hypothetical protein